MGENHVECPFCGEKYLLNCIELENNSEGDYCIACNYCNCQGPPALSSYSAWECWDERGEH